MTTELLFRDDAYSKTATARVLAVHERGIELDRTIFYPMGGGQVGDTGRLVRASGERVAIADTRKGDSDIVLHVPLRGIACPEIGEAVTLEIDWERRYALMRLHTALHGDVVRGRRAGHGGQHRAARGLIPAPKEYGPLSEVDIP